MAEASYFPKKKTFLVRKDTIDKRANEVLESEKTVCPETELARGYEAPDRGGTRVFCSFADTVALMFWSFDNVHCRTVPGFL